MDFENAQKFLNSLINYEQWKSPYYDFKLDKFRKFLKELNNPQDRLNNVVLIAGTKGKGSTGFLLESALNSCGLKTGYFTKPHLTSICERIRIFGRPISKKDFANLVSEIKPLARKHKITFFEAITAMAFLYFLRKDLDYTIFEVGLGGRLDATNLVNPVVSVITRIGYDHIEILGRTLSKIAKEKAGIIRKDGYVVSSAQEPNALKVILDKVREQDAQLFLIGQNLKATNKKISQAGVSFRAAGKTFFIPALGGHQIANGLTALGVLLKLKSFDSRITWTGVIKGFKTVKIPGRCQLISLKDGRDLILDVGHNPESSLALREVLEKIFKAKAILIFGASQGKLIKQMVKILAPVAERFILTQSNSPRAVSAKELEKIVKPFKVAYQVIPNVGGALKKALEIDAQSSLIAVTGSFYVAGEALEWLEKYKI